MWKVGRPLDAYTASRHTPTRAQVVVLLLTGLAILTLLFLALEILVGFEL
jgi:hypothetical protein